MPMATAAEFRRRSLAGLQFRELRMCAAQCCPTGISVICCSLCTTCTIETCLALQCTRIEKLRNPTHGAIGQPFLFVKTSIPFLQTAMSI